MLWVPIWIIALTCWWWVWWGWGGGGMLCTQCKNAALAKHCIQQAGHLEIILHSEWNHFFLKSCGGWHFMQTEFQGENLHEMPIPIFWIRKIWICHLLSLPSGTSLLVVKMLTVMVSTRSNSQVFLLKNVHSFCKCKNISICAIFNDQSFNDTLTNNIVSFEQLDPEH